MHSTCIYLFAIASLLTIAKITPIKSQHHLPNLDTVKQWNLLTYDFPWNWPVNDKELNNPEQIVATGFEVSYNRIFIATPRLFSGVPATLSSIPRGSIGDSPVLQVNRKTNLSIPNINWKIFQRHIRIGHIIHLGHVNIIALILV